MTSTDAVRRWRERNPERNREQARAHYHRHADKAKTARYFAAVLQKYGLTKSGYCELLAAQDLSCAICDDIPERRLDVDHCHDTGKVRGLLCGNCNRALGLFGHDAHRLSRAAVYLGG